MKVHYSTNLIEVLGSFVSGAGIKFWFNQMHLGGCLAIIQYIL